MKKENSTFCGILGKISNLRLKNVSHMRFLLHIFRKCCECNFEEDPKITAEDFESEAGLSRDVISSSSKHLLERGIIRRNKYGRSFSYGLEFLEKQTDKDMEEKAEEKPKEKKEPKKVQKKKPLWKKPNKTKTFFDLDVCEWDYDHFGQFLVHQVSKQCETNNIDRRSKIIAFGKGRTRGGVFNSCMAFLNLFSGEEHCKLMFKAYIEWFARAIVVNVLTKGDKITSEYMSKEWNLDKFIKEFHLVKGDTNGNAKKISKACDRIVSGETSGSNADSVSKDRMDEKYSLGTSTLLSECGIVLAGNYLLKYKNKSFNEAAKEIHVVLQGLNIRHPRQKKSLLGIVDATCIRAPYYKEMQFLHWKNMFQDVFSQLNGELDMNGYKIVGKNNRNKNYDFLLTQEEIGV